MRKLLIGMLSLAFLLTAVCGLNAAPAQAATKKVTYYDFLDEPENFSSADILDRFSTKVKTGTTNLKVSKGSGYLRFTAPETNLYSLTFSDLKNEYAGGGFIMFFTTDGDDASKVATVTADTKGGVSETLYLCRAKDKQDTKGKTLERYLRKRTGKIILEKGQTLYIFVYFGYGKKSTCRLSLTKDKTYKKYAPSAPALTNAFYNASAKKMKITWSSSKKAAGYEIQISLSEKLNKVTAQKVKSTSAIFTVKKGKMYYMRVRGYRKSGGKTYYSAWSRVRKRKAASK